MTKRNLEIKSTEDVKKLVDKLVPMAELELFLQNCDYICNVLPNTPATTECLNTQILSQGLGKSPVFVNVGRANVISDQTLLQALDSGWFSAAILDVFHQEPLPSEHAFWNHPKIVVTPHVSALSRPEDIAECFVTNLDLCLQDKPLQNLVNWKESY